MKPLAVASSLLLLGLLNSAASGQLSPANQPNSGRDCALCHLEWVKSFDESRAVNLMEKPSRPAVAESESCLGCHDGSVSDSRREVWIDHGHKTGVAPSAGMKVPANLPLDDGKLACRTCHTAHTAAEATALKDTVFLRMKNDEGQLCKACHVDHAPGPSGGSHPLTAMAFPLPATLASAGAHAGAKQDHVVCQTCHTAHGASQDHLLIMATDSSQLCITCHEKMRPAMWQADAHEHPQNPPLKTDAQRQAIKDMGTKLGADGKLICLSCHKMHEGKSGRAMLADTLADSKLCIRCHAERQPMLASAHDLRKTAPKEPNSRGETPDQSGPCGACHTFHSYARTATPIAGDPQGLCTTCHAEGKVAATHTGRLSHPAELDQDHIPTDLKLALYPSKDDPKKKSIACLSCHNPHETGHPRFLRSTGDDLCASCHAARAQKLSGPHDFSKKDYRNARGQTAAETGRCGFCHGVHDANGPAMWIATKDKPTSPDSLCADCHKAGGIAEKFPAAMFNHPTGAAVRPTTRPASLPLFNANAHVTDAGFVGCATCHDIHEGGKQAKTLLRAQTPTELCTQCHTGQAAMAGSPHDATRSAKPFPGSTAQSADLCTSCHRPHSNDAAKGRWAVAQVNGDHPEDAACVSCHAANTPAPAAGAVAAGQLMHVQTIAADSAIRKILHNAPVVHIDKAPGGDLIACRTCHNPHAPTTQKFLLRNRPGEPASAVCTNCHTEPRAIESSMHSREFLDPDNKDFRACSPCHATHAVPGSDRKLLWSGPTNAAGRTEAEKLCLGCHSDTGGAVKPTMFQHPETALKKLQLSTSQPSELAEKLARIDQITCSTCHIPHGREIEVPKDLPPALAKVQLSGIKPMLRPDVDRQICATCHGVDATRVYLYFHNPKKRAAVQRLVEP